MTLMTANKFREHRTHHQDMLSLDRWCLPQVFWAPCLAVDPWEHLKNLFEFIFPCSLRILDFLSKIWWEKSLLWESLSPTPSPLMDGPVGPFSGLCHPLTPGVPMWACVDGSQTQQKQKEPCEVARKIPTGSLSAQRGLREALEGKSITAVKGKYVQHEIVSDISHPTIRHCPQLSEFFSPHAHTAPLFGVGELLARGWLVAGVKWVTSSSEGNTLYPASHCCCLLLRWATTVVTSSHLRLMTCDVFWSGGLKKKA